MEINANGPKRSLARSIRQILFITLITSGALTFGAAGDTSDAGTVSVTHPYPPDPPEFPTDPAPNPNPGQGGGDGGDGDNGGENEQDIVCENLMATKPPSCPNPIEFPHGSLYAQDQLPGPTLTHKSAIPMAIAFGSGKVHGPNSEVNVDHAAALSMVLALEWQTQAYANPANTFESVNRSFRAMLSNVCETQSAAANSYRLGGQLTVQENYCFEMMKAYDEEANDSTSFAEYFVDWTNRYHIPLSDYIPDAIISSVSSENSLGVKWRVTSADATCSRWWTKVEENQCH